MVGLGVGLTTGTQRSENMTKIIFHNNMEERRKGKRKVNNNSYSMLRYAPVTKRKTEVKFNSLIEGGNSETNYGKLMNFLKKRNVRNYNDLLKELKNTTKNIGNVKNYELNHYINTKTVEYWNYCGVWEN